MTILDGTIPDGWSLRRNGNMLRTMTMGSVQVDPAWRYTDRAGHLHQVADGELPTLYWWHPDQEANGELPTWYEEERDPEAEVPSGEWRCPLCQEAISPATVPVPTQVIAVPGLESGEATYAGDQEICTWQLRPEELRIWREQGVAALVALLELRPPEARSFRSVSA